MASGVDDETNPDVEQMLTILPLPAATMTRAAACSAKYRPFRLMPTCTSQSSSVASRRERARATPALLTSTSRRPPPQSTTASTMARTAAMSSMSTTNGRAPPPPAPPLPAPPLPAAAEIDAATDAAVSGLRSATATRAPSCANREAMAAPMPCPAPVTITIWPSKRPIAVSSRGCGRRGPPRARARGR